MFYLYQGSHSVVCDSVLCLGRRLEDSGIKLDQKYKVYQIALFGNSVTREVASK